MHHETLCRQVQTYNNTGHEFRPLRCVTVGPGPAFPPGGPITVSATRLTPHPQTSSVQKSLYIEAAHKRSCLHQRSPSPHPQPPTPALHTQAPAPSPAPSTALTPVPLTSSWSWGSAGRGLATPQHQPSTLRPPCHALHPATPRSSPVVGLGAPQEGGWPHHNTSHPHRALHATPCTQSPPGPHQ